MRKKDVKAFFLIFIILLIISTVAMIGLNKYIDIMLLEGNEQNILYQGNVIVTPDENTVNNFAITQNENGILNQIASAGNQNQATQPNVITDGYQYYYKQIDSYAQIIYEELENNKENMKTGTYKLDFEKKFNDLLEQENGADLLQESYQSAMEAFLYDNPDVFYLEPTKMYINIETTKKVFTTTYQVYIDCGENANYLADGYNSKEQIEEYEDKLNQAVEQILKKTSGKNNYQKIQAIHDYLIDNVVYEESISKDNIYNMYGALVNKEAVCEGYAKAFKYLMDQIGVESIVVIGSATDSKGKSQNHAWNYVNINNTWYAVDVTWDDPIIIGGGIATKRHRYKYFLKGSATMNKDHIESYTFVENGKVYEHPVLSVTDY